MDTAVQQLLGKTGLARGGKMALRVKNDPVAGRRQHREDDDNETQQANELAFWRRADTAVELGEHSGSVDRRRLHHDVLDRQLRLHRRHLELTRHSDRSTTY